MNRDIVIRDTQEYLSKKDTSHPLFIAFDNEEDLSFLCQQFSTTCNTLKLSSYCSNDDAFPNLDQFFSDLQKKSNVKMIILGCGEYAELHKKSAFLSRLFDFQCNSTQKFIIPLWNAYSFFQSKQEDPRIDNTRVLAFPPSKKYWHLKKIPSKITYNAIHGIKRILMELETGCEKKLVVKTTCELNDKWCRTITSAFEMYGMLHPSANLSKNLFSEEIWKLFLDEKRVPDEQIWSADTFLKFKLNVPVNDPYLLSVINKTESYFEYRLNLLTTIWDESPNSSQYPVLYASWKKVLAQFPEDDVRFYLSKSQKLDDLDRLAYLTNNTSMEQLEILRIISKTKRVPDLLTDIYPLLASYTTRYSFGIQNNPDLSQELTDYFEAYKQQKLFNELTPAFVEQMEQVAMDRPYNVLPTRGSVLEKLKGEQIHLMWIDALGCEFLGFIQRRSADLGLKLNVHVTRAKLPTLTSVNRDFFDEWNCGTKDQNKQLDELKHGDFEDYGFDRAQMPVELVYELDVLDKALIAIAKHLKTKKSKSVVLASDHGATRLAVISKDETFWEMPEKGKHSGRCCRTNEFDGELPPYVTHDEENEWNVMANYSRFKGGRKADVEVHGGATLEEVIVPVVEFKLLDKALEVELVEKVIKVHFRDKSTKLVLFCDQPLDNLVVELDGKRYSCTVIPENTKKHEAVLPKLRAGKYKLSLFDGDTQLNSVEFTVKSSGTGVKEDKFF